MAGEFPGFLCGRSPDRRPTLAQPSLLDAVNGVFCQLGSKKLSRFKDAAVEGPCSLDQPPTFPANRSYNPRACT